MGGTQPTTHRWFLNGALMALTALFAAIGAVGSLRAPDSVSDGVIEPPTPSPNAGVPRSLPGPLSLPFRPTRGGEYAHVPNRAGSYHDGSPDLSEASGLTASSRYPGVFWFIRDAGSGDRAQLYALRIDPVTGLLADIDGDRTTVEIAVNGATNTDWEAIASDGEGNLWIGDIGDFYPKNARDVASPEATGRSRDRNNSDEPDLAVIRVPEPDPSRETAVTVSQVVTYTFPDEGSWNSEALFWLGDWLYLLTKETPQRVFRFPNMPTGDGSVTLQFVAHVAEPLPPITGAALSADHSLLALSTALERMIVLEGAGGTPATVDEADAIVAALVGSPVRSWHYYYLDAAALAADGALQRARPSAGPDGLHHRTDMEVEGVAFAGDRIALISEFGRHVLSVPPTADTPNWGWKDRSGSGGS